MTRGGLVSFRARVSGMLLKQNDLTGSKVHRNQSIYLATSTNAGQALPIAPLSMPGPLAGFFIDLLSTRQFNAQMQKQIKTIYWTSRWMTWCLEWKCANDIKNNVCTQRVSIAQLHAWWRDHSNEVRLLGLHHLMQFKSSSVHGVHFTSIARFPAAF